jgi:RNA polymerase sigma-70 factor, ECF subfamily
VAGILMRRILVDEARHRQAEKNGGRALRVSLGDAECVALQKSHELLALDDALTALAELDERRSRIVELRFFGGLSIEETAEVLHVSPRTVAREWRLAQAWLYRELNNQSEPAEEA